MSARRPDRTVVAMRTTADIPSTDELGCDPEPPGLRFRLLAPDDPRRLRFARRLDEALDLALGEEEPETHEREPATAAR